MNIFNKEINIRYALWIFLHVLIVIDIVVLTIEMFFSLPEDVIFYIQFYDLIICIILLVEWFYVFHISRPKLLFLKQKSNWIDLIASIPFDAILPVVFPQINILRYLRLLKLLRVVALFNRFFDNLQRFIETSNLDKILGGVFFTILFFTLLLSLYGSTYGLFDYFYFVIVTLTTVGYGDVTPTTFNEKVISIFLIFAGVFVFSTITASISSYFTDRILDNNDEIMEENISNMIDEKLNSVNEKLDSINNENMSNIDDEKLDSLNNKLELIHEENNKIKQEIEELKELIEDKL